MSLLESVLDYNRAFVEGRKYEAFLTDKLPSKKYVVISCMDTRLVELLAASMDIHNGDVKMVKTGGAVVSGPWDSVMKSILVAVYGLGAEEVFLVGHYDCGMGKVQFSALKEKMLEKGISQETFDTIEGSGIVLDEWLKGFPSEEGNVENGVNVIKKHPLMPNIPVHGLIIDPKTGKLNVVVEGYETVETR